MSEDEYNNRCLYCREAIQPDASRCPHCASWQVRWMGAHEHPWRGFALLAALLAAMTLLVGVVITLDTRARAKLPQLSATEALEITAYSFELGEDPVKPLVVILGELKNLSDQPYRDVYFHLELHDANGELLDAVSPRVRQLIIGPGEATSFRISVEVLAAPDAVANHSLEVRSATWIRPPRP